MPGLSQHISFPLVDYTRGGLRRSAYGASYPGFGASVARGVLAVIASAWLSRRLVRTDFSFAEGFNADDKRARSCMTAAADDGFGHDDHAELERHDPIKVNFG